MVRKQRSIILALVFFSSQVFANESGYVCHPEKFTLADAEATYAYGQDYEQYEYSFEYLKEHWTAVVYRFYQLPNTNPILKDITPDDSEDLLLQKIFSNASKALKENSLADSISETKSYETDQGSFLTFTADSVLGQQYYGFLVHRENTELLVYRIFYIADESTDELISDGAASTVMQALVQSCRSIVTVS